MPLYDKVQRQLPASMRPASDGKLLEGHRPDLAYREHVAVQSVSGVLQAEIDGFTDYAKVYRSYVWVRKALGVIAQNFAPLPVRVVDAEGEVVPGHPVTELLETANDTSSQVDLWETYVVHKLLGGEAFFELLVSEGGRPLEIWPRRPDLVGVVPDASPERQLYPRVAHYTFGPDDAPPIPPENMWHDRFMNPLSRWRGLAPITAVRNAIIIDLFAAGWSRAFLKQGARPDYAVIASAGLTPSEKKELEMELSTRFMGSGNWHRPIVLEQGVEDVKPLGWAPVDIQWLEQRRFARDEVGAVFGVPDEVMGYGRDTYENMDAAHRWLWLLTLVPMATGRDHSLTRFFTKVRPMLQPGQFVRTDLSGVPALQENIAEKIQAAQALFAMGVPFDVIDERLGLGIGNIPGGTVGYLPMALLPVGTPYQPAGVAAGQVAGQVTAVEFGSAKHQRLVKAFEGRKRPHEQEFKRQLKRQLQEQQNRVMRALRSEMGQAAVGQLLEQAHAIVATLDAAERAVPLSDINRTATATNGQRKDDMLGENPFPSLASIFNFRAERSIFEAGLRPLFEIVVDDFGASAIDELGIVELGDTWDIYNPAVQRMVEGMTFKFADDITTTTQQMIGTELRGVLDEVVEQGLSIPDAQRLIHDRISSVFDVRKSDYETERIARTEVNRASNQGTLSGWQQSNVVTHKSWLAGLDDRTRDTHLAAHAQYQSDPIPLEQDFQVGACSTPAPGASGCPGEDINCRCTMLAVMKRN